MKERKTKEKSDERREHKWKHKILTDSCKGKGKLFFSFRDVYSNFSQQFAFYTNLFKENKTKKKKKKEKKKYKTSEFTHAPVCQSILGLWFLNTNVG